MRGVPTSYFVSVWSIEVIEILFAQLHLFGSLATLVFVLQMKSRFESDDKEIMTKRRYFRRPAFEN